MRSAEISVNAIRKKLSSQSYNCKSNPHSQIKFVFLSSVGTKTFWHEKRLIFFNQSVALAIHAISLSIPYNQLQLHLEAFVSLDNILAYEVPGRCLFTAEPNQKFSWEHSGIKVGNVCSLLIIVRIMAGICRVY